LKSKYGDRAKMVRHFSKEAISVVPNDLDFVYIDGNHKYSYVFEDLKSIDVVFLFLEIVKFTTGRKIKINYIDEEENRLETIEFDEKNFNYFKLIVNIRNV
jgi:hypothetical protein